MTPVFQRKLDLLLCARGEHCLPPAAAHQLLASLPPTAVTPPTAGGGGGVFAGGGAAEDITRDGAPLTLYRVHAAIAADLRAIQRRVRVPVIASKHVLFPGGCAAGLGDES